MNNNSKALENLKQSAKQQSNELNSTIIEIYKKQLNHFLTNLESTQKKRNKELLNYLAELHQVAIEEVKEINRWKNRTLIVSSLTTGILIGIAIATIMMKLIE